MLTSGNRCNHPIRGKFPAYDGDPRSTTLEAKTMDSNVATKRAAARTQRPFILTYAEQVRAWSAYRGGSQGAAGPCKRISPVTGEVVEVIQAR
jgi:hypothetical protein